jgi:predicted lipase
MGVAYFGHSNVPAAGLYIGFIDIKLSLDPDKVSLYSAARVVVWAWSDLP